MEHCSHFSSILPAREPLLSSPPTHLYLGFLVVELLRMPGFMSSHPQLLTPIAFQFVFGQRGTWQLHAALKVALSRVPKWLQLGDLRVKFHPVDDSWSKSYLEDLCRITWYHFVFGETVKNCVFFAARTPKLYKQTQVLLRVCQYGVAAGLQAPVASTRNGSERQVWNDERVICWWKALGMMCFSGGVSCFGWMMMNDAP